MSEKYESVSIERAREALRPYFTGLDDPKTRIVPVADTRRARDDEEAKVLRARELMAAAAAGRHPKRVPLEARENRDGTFTILDGKSTHACLERLGLQAVPLVVVEAVDAAGRLRD